MDKKLLECSIIVLTLFMNSCQNAKRDLRAKDIFSEPYQRDSEEVYLPPVDDCNDYQYVDCYKDKNIVLYDSIYTSPRTVYNEDFDFKCPGHSVLIGERSQVPPFTKLSGREFHFVCAFLKDGQGFPIFKNSCFTSSLQKGDIEYACPGGMFLSGQKGTLTPNGLYHYNYQCCSLQSRDKKAVVKKSEQFGFGNPIDFWHTSSKDSLNADLAKLFNEVVPNFRVNESIEAVEFSCDGSMLILNDKSQYSDPTVIYNGESQFIPLQQSVIHKVSSKLVYERNIYEHRSYSFYCSQLVVGP